MLKAIGTVEAAEAALAEAQGNTARHLVDKALGNAGAAPLTVREARAAVIAAQDHLEECRATRAALKTELDGGNNGWSVSRVTDAAVAVLRAEVAARGVALAAEISQLQRELVARGSALEWLARVGAFREPGGRHGEAADKNIRDTVERLDVAPNQWATGTINYGTSVFEPTGRLKWEKALERLKTDPNAALPEDM